MSFSNEIKNELAHLEQKKKCCEIAELAGLVRMDGTILIGSRKGIGLELTTENAAVARKAFKGLKKLFNVETEITVQRRNRLKKNNVYLVRVPGQPKVMNLLDTLGLMKDGLMYNPEISSTLVKKECCKRSYLRGVFLGAGSLSDPMNSYHLEIVANSEEYADSLVHLIETFGLHPKISSRKNVLLVYLKESEQIADFLNIIGAHQALLELENIRVQKEVRNQVNRLVNCESANMNKTIDAAVRQKSNIEFVLKYYGLEKLNDGLRAVAEARLEYPEVSLKELGTLMDPPLGKSGINHRMRKLEELADELRSKGYGAGNTRRRSNQCSSGESFVRF